MRATAALATATAPEPQPTAEEELLAALAQTARQPLAPGGDQLGQRLDELLWRRGPSR